MAHFSTISGFLFNENVLEKDLKICHILGQKNTQNLKHSSRHFQMINSRIKY